MGIHKFFGFLAKHPRLKKAIKYRLPENISSFYVDCNGIFHNAKADVYLKSNTKGKSKEELEKKHIHLIMEKLKEILVDFGPSDLLVLAPDGPAVCGKMNQQKSRRFKSVHYKGDESIDLELFDGNSISPGTEFMFKIDKAIKKWLSEEKNLPRKVIYSSHMSEGEGEHLLVEMIRRGHADVDGIGVFYGLDGDLILLTLLSPLEKLFLARENKENILDINYLRKLLREELNFENCKTTLLIQDFVFLVSMIGNDFLHRLPLLHDTENSMNVLIDVYKTTKLHLTNYQGKVEWDNLLTFWKNLDNYKIGGHSLYELHIRKPLTFPYEEYQKATTIRTIKGQPTHDKYDQSKHIIDFDIKYFTQLWYEKQFKPQKAELIDMFKDGKYFDKNDVINMCKFYLKVLEWNLGYYLGGHDAVSKNLFYPFFYSPMLPSLINYLEFLIVEKKLYVLENKLEKDPIDHSAIHQLMLVLPPQSKNLIPEPFRKLYTEKLKSISPSEFIIKSPEGTDADHVTLALIPPINPYLVTRVIADSGIPIPDKYKSEGLMIIETKREQNFRKFNFSYDIPHIYLI